MREGSPMFEPFKQEEKQKEEKRTQIGGIIKKAVAVGAAVTALAGAGEYGKFIAQNDKNIINNDKTGLEEKIKMEEALQELVKDPYSGYVDLDHYLEDHREVRENPEKLKKLEEARKYFEARKNK